VKYLEKLGKKLEDVLILPDTKNIVAAIYDSAVAYFGVPYPIATVVTNLISVYDKIKEGALMEKAVEFAEEFSIMNIDDRQLLIERMNEDPIYGQKFGTFLLVSLERMDFKIKAKYLARACNYYHLNYISKSNFIRLKTIIENINMGDVEEYILVDTKSMEHDDFPDLSFKRPKREKEPAFIAFLNLGIIFQKYDFDSLKQAFQNDKYNNSISYNRVIKSELTTIGQQLYYMINDIKPSPRIIGYWKEEL